jgi:hypothetical protein
LCREAELIGALQRIKARCERDGSLLAADVLTAIVPLNVDPPERTDVSDAWEARTDGAGTADCPECEGRGHHLLHGDDCDCVYGECACDPLKEPCLECDGTGRAEDGGEAE